MKSGAKDRAIILTWVYERILKLYPGAEIILSTQDKRANFNKAETINNAVKTIKRDILAICDADIFFSKDLIDLAIKELDNYSLIIPYRDCNYYDVEATKDILKYNPSINLSQMKSYDTNVYENAYGGLNIIRREDFNYIKGFDERFNGWGCEDVAFAYKAKTILSMNRFDRRIYHLYHYPNLPDASFELNKLLYSEIASNKDRESLIKYYNIK
jgi:predicted glycosyltransferase involved in capsule biosynthesis